MKQLLKWSFLCLLSVIMGCSSPRTLETNSPENLSQYVEPRIGTAHCRWFHFAPGALPFGLAKPAPATNASLGNKYGWEATGYDYRDTSIEGFSCLHEFQIGGIVLMPTVGTLKTVPGGVNSLDEGYRSTFDHADEVAQPGYYSVLLKDYNIKAELTATDRVAYQRFTFPESTASHILFDVGNRQGESGAVVDSEVTITDTGLIEGWVETLSEYTNKYQSGATIKIYFSAQMDKKPVAVGTFMKKKVYGGNHHIQGVGAGAYLTYATTTGESITAQVGLSYTSVFNARLNRETETHKGALNFDEVHQTSASTWEEYLSRIRVESSSKADKTKFYTGLYHAVLGRGMANDVNGAYPRHDGSIGQLPMKEGKPAFRFCNTDGIWGAQWNLIQVWALAYPEYLSDFVSTHLQVYKDAGWMGDGIANSRYVSGVGTNQLGNVIAAAYACGIRDFDIDTAYAAARKNALNGDNRPLGAGKVDTDKFLKYGYCPFEAQGTGPAEAYQFSGSHTLEYSFGAYAVAQMAKELGHAQDYKRLMYLSKGWERIYDSTLQMIRPRLADGSFIQDFDPMEVWRGFQEGNAWQYTFYVPHDVKGLVSKMGADEFNARLDSIFTLSEDKIFSGGAPVGGKIDAFSGLRTLYNQGNQPCLHIPWLFNESGKPSLTQKWVRAILDKFYGTDGIHGYGYGQDEDEGQLGAWYVISSIGLFDVTGLATTNPQFAIGSSIFDKVTIRLNKKYFTGDTFVIQTLKNSQTNCYIENITLDDKPFDGLHIPFETVIGGGKLTLTLGNKPID